MTESSIYTVGGTVQAGGGIYIKRKADDQLLELCRQSEFAFILSSRQVGKSSLMVRTAQQLKKENTHSVTIDLSAIGIKVSQDEWYLGILNEISNSLNLKTDIFSWWAQYSQLGPAQRLINFFRDVLLKEVNEPIILFFDEIDSTLSIPFSDDFYIGLRAVYNARSTTPDFKRLSFVLVGVAAPSDLISDNKRTPFNIGRRVEINDFTLEEALPLADGLGQQATRVLKWIFQYTSGHPYLTQRLCAYLARSKEIIDEQVVASAVERLFTGEEGKQDNNLQFVRDMLAKRSRDATKVLLIYRDIRSGKKVLDDERSIEKAHLKLSGLVRSEQGILSVRNHIYSTVFNLRWVGENIPKNWQKVALISLSVSLGVLMLATLAVFINDFLVGTRVNKNIADFISTTSSAQRLSNLAVIYTQKGVLSNTDASLQAAQLFYGLTASDQLSMLTDYSISQDSELQDQLLIVVSHLYVTVADVNPNEDNTDLLEAMHNSLSMVSNKKIAVDLQNEIGAWLKGREKARNGDYQDALNDYNDAISFYLGNQATLYERAKVYIELGQYANALKDLDSAIAAAQRSAPAPPATPFPTETFVPTSAIPTLVEDNPKGIASQQVTGSPSGIINPPVETLTPTAESTVTPVLAPPVTETPRTDRYESNFTTLIDVINAVRTLIESTSDLQVMIQSGEQSDYANLQSVGLIRDYPVPTSTSVASVDELVSAAKTEGTLNVIALPHDWCNYGEVIESFKTKYGLEVNELNPNAGSGDELEAIRVNKDNPGPQSPDVVDVGLLFAVSGKTEDLFVPYKVSTWSSIPSSTKDEEGYWYGAYYGVISFLVNTDVQPTVPQSWPDLFNPGYTNQVALSGDPRTSNQAIKSVISAALANGGTLEDVQAGLDFFAELFKFGNLNPVISNNELVATGETPIRITWDWNARAAQDAFSGNPTTQVVIPADGRLADYYIQAISAYAPHPNAAKLWMEFLYSDDAQLLYMKGYCHPIREADLFARGVIPSDLSEILPVISDVQFMTADQINPASEFIRNNWDTAVGADIQAQQ